MKASTGAAAAATKRHVWFGEWLDDAGLDAWLEECGAGGSRLAAHLSRVLPLPFPMADFLQASDAIAASLVPGNPFYERCREIVLRVAPAEEAEGLFAAIRGTLARGAVQEKMRSELGMNPPGVVARRYPGRQFEAWFPLGCVVHVMPANVFTAPVLGLMEGLMAGNVNIVKVSARDTEFAAVFADELCRLDPGGRLRDYVAVARLSSSDGARMGRLFGIADGVSAWGGERAIAAIREAIPSGTKLIAWGHKVSFSYLAAESLADAGQLESTLRAMATDVCRLDQQACSSPQTLFVEVDQDEDAARQIAERLAAHLAEVSPEIPGQPPSASEQAEITSVTAVVRAEKALGLTELFEDEQGRWRVLFDARAGLRPSPLYRTIWVKPIRRAELTATLRPMRAWLQTCGLSCGLASLADLSRALFAAGVTRICRAGEMVDSYIGAPHDGVYALHQLTRRVSLDGPAEAEGVGCLNEFETRGAATAPTGAIQDKDAFMKLAETVERPELVVKSGGSSGKTVYSLYSWADYHQQMLWTAHGLVAAGVEPARDRVMNCYTAGYLYGSLISFWTILEFLRVPQYPMGMINDYEYIADVIESNRVNTLLGVPSHLLGLFNACADRLRGKVEKIFFGGEKMTAAQREYLMKDCGVSVVRSAVYGSNDAGPMGYQCPHCVGGQHHLLSALMKMEIVALDEDRPVAAGETGRILLSPITREYPRVNRYEIGDTGRWVAEPCPCGRTDPRFELLGRTGDIFKAAGPFFNYRRFVDILETELGYTGPVQIHLAEEGHTTVLEVWMTAPPGAPAPAVIEDVLRENYAEIQYAYEMGMAFLHRVRVVEADEVKRNAASGKVIPICDQRR